MTSRLDAGQEGLYTNGITNSDTMSKLISVKIDEAELLKLEASARAGRMSRNACINKAVRLFNRVWERKLLARELQRESDLVRRESSGSVS